MWHIQVRLGDGGLITYYYLHVLPFEHGAQGAAGSAPLVQCACDTEFGRFRSHVAAAGTDRGGHAASARSFGLFMHVSSFARERRAGSLCFVVQRQASSCSTFGARRRGLWLLMSQGGLRPCSLRHNSNYYVSRRPTSPGVASLGARRTGTCSASLFVDSLIATTNFPYYNFDNQHRAPAGH